MEPQRFERIGEYEWRLPAAGAMHVPGVIFAGEALIRDMDDKVAEQVANVAALPGIVAGSFAMPDAHWGYGFSIGGVAAFDPEQGGRSLSRHAALKRYHGREVVDTLAQQGVIVRSPSLRGIAEEAPGAYKNIDAVVDAADHAGLARKVAQLRPLVCIKG